MKVIKKITAIMLSIMMVLGMSSVVSAAETSGTYNDDIGSITINAAIKDHPYTIYRILQLESFSGDDTNLENGNYAYKVETGWDGFVNDTAKGGKYLEKDADGYVTWKTGADEKKFAKEALEYAKTLTTSGSYKNTQTTTTNTLTFSGLKLGYYLVDSSVGSLCFLGTTNKDVTIQEKNGVPSVEKMVKSGTTYKKKNTASIGDEVEFQTTITAQAGAQSYVLHDKMSDGLTFSGTVSVTKEGRTLNGTTDYSLDVNTLTAMADGCAFEIKFTQSFCDTLKANDQIIVTYSAILNEKAKIKTDDNKNETWLKYGDGKESTHDSTITKTFEIPVFKYTDKLAKGGAAESPLEGAKFILRKTGSTKGIGLKSITAPTGEEGDYYRFDKATTAETEVTTNNTGKFTIQGLASGTYELVEKEPPKGYNKLPGFVEITIDEDGKVSYNTETNATWVKVENKSGSLLPSTGGRGTTLFYILGAILVVGSGVVLITKKRMK